MSIIHAVYENGIFRPTEAVVLPEGATVRIEVLSAVELPFLPPQPGDPPELIGRVDVRAMVPPGTDEALIRVYEAMAARYRSNEPSNILETHNEHQP